MKRQFEMLHPDEALRQIETIKVNPRAEEVPLLSAHRRVLADPLSAPIDSPPFSKATMDGYAVRADDGSKVFRLVETIAAGDIPCHEIDYGECAKIMTGAQLPVGAQKVIRVEYTEQRGDSVHVKQAESEANLIERGAHIRAGDNFLNPKILRAQDIGSAASMGIDRLKVVVPPLIGVVTTGSELVESGEKLGPGKIYNSNEILLCTQIDETNCRYRSYGTIADNKSIMIDMFISALSECDVLLVSGGVSMGDFDFVPSAVEETGAKILFHKMAVKPGKPTLFAKRDDKYVFGLPGNPVSTFVIFEVFVKVLIFRLMGIRYAPIIVEGAMAQDFTRKDTSRVEFRLVAMEEGRVTPIPYHGSSHIHALIQATGLMRVEQGVGLIEKGQPVSVRLI